MKIQLKLKSDSDNSSPRETLDIHIFENDEVYFNISDETRQVSVRKEELKKLIHLL